MPFRNAHIHVPEGINSPDCPCLTSPQPSHGPGPHFSEARGVQTPPQSLLATGLGLLWAAHTPRDALTLGERLINKEPAVGSKVCLEHSALGNSAKSNSPVEKRSDLRAGPADWSLLPAPWITVWIQGVFNSCISYLLWKYWQVVHICNLKTIIKFCSCHLNSINPSQLHKFSQIYDFLFKLQYRMIIVNNSTVMKAT